MGEGCLYFVLLFFYLVEPFKFAYLDFYLFIFREKEKNKERGTEKESMKGVGENLGGAGGEVII